ncbi:hypothetical protein IC582_012205 [Cucumis melo]
MSFADPCCSEPKEKNLVHPSGMPENTLYPTETNLRTLPALGPGIPHTAAEDDRTQQP